MTSSRIRANARVRLVVDEDVPAVIGAVGVGRARMVQVAVQIGLLAARLRGTALPSGVRPSVMICRLSFVMPQPVRTAAVEYGNAHEFAHGGQAENAQFARVSA